MDGFNVVTLIGSVGKDAETKLFGENTQKTTFSIATNRSFKNKKGEKETHTDWHNIEVWGEPAKYAANWVKKGNVVSVIGELRYDKFEDKEGKPQIRAKIYVTRIQIIKSNNANGTATDANSASQANIETASKQTEEYANNTVSSGEFVGGEDINEDLPF